MLSKKQKSFVIIINLENKSCVKVRKICTVYQILK
jgi:hypothetical protein